MPTSALVDLVNRTALAAVTGAKTGANAQRFVILRLQLHYINKPLGGYFIE